LLLEDQAGTRERRCHQGNRDVHEFPPARCVACDFCPASVGANAD
jgi:hypothetical protein